MFFRTLVPEKHLSSDTQDVVKLGIALIATMATLVLGLLVASAKSTYDTRRTQLLQVSADIILLDRVLANYGPETQDARVMLQRSVAAVLEQFWPANRARLVTIDRSASSVESVYDNIQRLAPRSDAQRSLQAQALTIAFDLGRTRVLLFEQLDSSIPLPFLVVLVFWLAVIFVSFGLFAPRNGIVAVAFFVCGLSVSGAIFLILELDRSFPGKNRMSEGERRRTSSQNARLPRSNADTAALAHRGS